MNGATLKGRAGRYHVWHRGPNDYAVTEGRDGAVVGTREQYGLAFKLAQVLHDLDPKPEAVLREALAKISLTEQDNTTPAADKVRSMAKTARAALARVQGGAA